MVWICPVCRKVVTKRLEDWLPDESNLPTTVKKRKICTECGNVMLGKYSYRLSKDEWMEIILELAKVKQNFDLYYALQIVNRMKNENKGDMTILRYLLMFA